MDLRGGFLRRVMNGEGSPFATGRRAMLRRLREGGVTDERVLRAMAGVPREEFVGEGHEGVAYADRALPIGYGQTISQPLMVGIMVEALEIADSDLVLDVGTGTGYQAAVLAACGARVVGIERLPRLAATARLRLSRLGYDVEVLEGDGSEGLSERGPFDGIVVGASAPRLPFSLLDDLADGGRLVIPVRRDPDGDRLLRVRRSRTGDGRTTYVEEDLGACRFVPLVGAEGFTEPEP